MAERWALPVGFLDDISAVEVISLGLEEENETVGSLSTNSRHELTSVFVCEWSV